MILRTSCPSCGEVDLASNDVLLLVQDDGDEEGTYCFVCPTLPPSRAGGG